VLCSCYEAGAQTDHFKVQKLLKSLTLILGGANSGKSRYAESLLADSEGNRIYIATAEAYDDEMRQKIEAHRAMRGPLWETYEAPLALAETLREAPEGVPILVDCVTLWLSNMLLAERAMDAEITALMEALQSRNGAVVVVSNEVGLGVVPDTSLGRRFRSYQGALNQQIAAEAERVVAVMAGLPLALKGDLP